MQVLPRPALSRRIWRMAGPIAVSNVSVPLVGIVDTAVMGRLDAAHYIGAVAIGAMIFNFLFHMLNCLRMGTTGPTAQAVGSGEWDEVRAMLRRALLLAGTAGAAIILLQAPISRLAFELVAASAEVEAGAAEYFLIRVWTAPANLAVFAIIGWFYGLEDSRVPLVLQIVVNAANILLDILFVMGFGWGVEGVAVASLISEYLGLAVAFAAVHRRLRRLPRGRGGRTFDWVRIARLIAINRDITIRSLFVVSANSIFLAESASADDVTLAANQILFQFLLFATYALDGVAHAGEALVGAAVGRRRAARKADGDELGDAVHAVLVWSGVSAAVFACGYLLASGPIIGIMTSLEGVRAAAGGHASWAVLMPLVSVWAFAYDGIFLGFAATRPMLATMGIAFAGFLVLVFVAALPGILGNDGLWLSFLVFHGLRGLGLGMAYPRLKRSLPAPPDG